MVKWPKPRSSWGSGPGESLIYGTTQMISQWAMTDQMGTYSCETEGVGDNFGSV